MQNNDTSLHRSIAAIMIMMMTIIIMITTIMIKIQIPERRHLPSHRGSDGSSEADSTSGGMWNRSRGSQQARRDCRRDCGEKIYINLRWNKTMAIDQMFQVRKQLSEIVAILRGAVLEKPLQTIISGFVNVLIVSQPIITMTS